MTRFLRIWMAMRLVMRSRPCSSMDRGMTIRSCFPESYRDSSPPRVHRQKWRNSYSEASASRRRHRAWHATTSPATGYDFVCRQGEREVKVEVKTFTADGRVILSANELRAAALVGDDYYLIGFIDNGSQQTWASRILQNPLPQLLDKGRFDLDVKPQAKAGDVFSLDDMP